MIYEYKDFGVTDSKVSILMIVLHLWALEEGKKKRLTDASNSFDGKVALQNCFTTDSFLHIFKF